MAWARAHGRRAAAALLGRAGGSRAGPSPRWLRRVAAASAGGAVTGVAAVSWCEPVKDIVGDGDRIQFWNEGWAEGRTGFHRTSVNPALLRWKHRLLETATDGAGSARVLVTLCGKTEDMPYLAGLDQVKKVVGCDGVTQAAEEFKREQPQLEMEWVAGSDSSTSDKTIKVLRSRNNKLDFIVGDFFELEPKDTAGQFECVLDRASLVAIRPEDREAYVGVLNSLLKKDGHILLITLERRAATNPDALKAGPPFSVPEKEVRRLFDQERFDVELLQSERLDIDGEYIRYKKRGITDMRQLVFLVKKR